VHDLRADRAEQHALQRVEAAGADDDQVGVLGRLDDDVARVAVRVDELGLDPALGQDRPRLLECAARVLLPRRVKVGALGEANADAQLGGGHDLDLAAVAGERHGALERALGRV
jgi:hypothetical protein